MEFFRKNIKLINLVLFIVSNSLFLKEVVYTTSFFKYVLFGFDFVLLILLIFSSLKKSLGLQYTLFFSLIFLLLGFTILIRIDGRNTAESITSSDSNAREQMIHENAGIKIPSTWETDSTDVILRLHFLNSDTLTFSMSPAFQEAYFLYEFSEKELVLRSIETKKVKFSWKIKSFSNSQFIIHEGDEEIEFNKQ